LALAAIVSFGGIKKIGTLFAENRFVPFYGRWHCHLWSRLYVIIPEYRRVPAAFANAT